ncbi:hypothetical protein G4B88_030954, partial [Cannabis sativa]
MLVFLILRDRVRRAFFSLFLSRYFSLSGMEILIKSLIESIPTLLLLSLTRFIACVHNFSGVAMRKRKNFIGVLGRNFVGTSLM